jgi:hypothetical protein
MHTIHLLKRALLATAVVGMLVPALGVAGAFKGNDCISVTKRPLSDFLDAQGSSSTFFPPVPDYVGWAGTDFVTFGLVDYAGLADAYIASQDPTLSLNTQVKGQVLECALPDGRARVTVTLVAANALGFAQSIAELIANDFDFAGTETNFGAKAVDVAAGATPAKGPAKLTTTFTIGEPGAPLPDFLDVNYTTDYAPASLDFSSKTIGRLPDGRRAALEIEQVATQDEDGVWTYSIEAVDIVVPGN